jgi:glycosyltransferase involved in cell wall biosynthesis
MDEKLKVLYVIRTLTHGGGAERLMFDIYQELKKRKNITCKIIVLQKSSFFKDFNIANSDFYENQIDDALYINYEFKLSIFKKNIINIEEYKNIVLEFKPDIIHSNLYLAEVVSREFILKKTIYITHVHDNIIQLKKLGFNTFLTKSKFTNYYERLRILKRYKKSNTYFISISNETNDYISKNLPKLFKKKIIKLPNAVNLSRFSLIPKALENRRFNLISIGSLAKRKNQTFLIDVLYYLNKKIEVNLTILGEGPERKEIENKIRDLGLEKQITLKGNLSDIEPFLNNSDLYIHAATSEPFGLVLIEAMASGLPVIALNGKGNKDIVINNYNGFLIEKPSIELMGDKIIEILENKKKFNELSKNAVEFAKKYSIEEYIDNLLNFYCNLKK